MDSHHCHGPFSETVQLGMKRRHHGDLLSAFGYLEGLVSITHFPCEKSFELRILLLSEFDIP